MTWSAHRDEGVSKDCASRVAYELAPVGESRTKLRLVHDDVDGPTATFSSAASWSLMLSSLKSLLETGKPLPTR